MEENTEQLNQRQGETNLSAAAEMEQISEPFLTPPAAQPNPTDSMPEAPKTSSGDLTIDSVRTSNSPEGNTGDIYLDTGENNNIQTNLSGESAMSQSADSLYPPVKAVDAAPQPAAAEAMLPPANQPPSNLNTGSQPAVSMPQMMAPTGVAQAAPGQIASADAPDLNRWNWGAFSLTWIWGLVNGVWLSLVALIPGFSLIIAIILGVKGGEWAWKSGKYKSIQDFENAQRAWNKWGIIFLIIKIAFIIYFIASIICVDDFSDSCPPGNFFYFFPIS